jgi:hypothetical protein
LNAGLCKAIELGRVVGEQRDPCAIQHSEHTRGDGVIALVVRKAERGIGVDGVEAIVLKLICSHLVGETKSATFLRQIKDDAAALAFDHRRAS